MGFQFIILISFLLINKAYSQCSGKATGYFPHPSQCDKYIICEDGKQVDEKLCPDGLVFEEYGNPARIRCQLPFHIDCSNRPQLQLAQPTAECPRANGMYPDEQDCTKFRECSEGVAYYKECPEGLAYNRNTANCDWPEKVEGCSPESLVGFNCPEATSDEIALYGHPRYSHPSDCKMLFACVATSDDIYGERKPRLLGCDYGSVFNPETKICDDPENVRGCETYYSSGLDARRSQPKPTSRTSRTDTRTNQQPNRRLYQQNNPNTSRNTNTNTYTSTYSRRNDGRYYG